MARSVKASPSLTVRTSALFFATALIEAPVDPSCADTAARPISRRVPLATPKT
jgi:hypothetical protein